MAVYIVAITAFQREVGFRSNAEDGKRPGSSRCRFEYPRSLRFRHSIHRGEFEEGLVHVRYAPN